MLWAGDQTSDFWSLRALVAATLSAASSGFSNWSLRLLAERVVALEIAPAISHETVRRTLKKTRPANPTG